MQIAVPEGVAPGQMVMVSTPGGQMQVVSAQPQSPPICVCHSPRKTSDMQTVLQAVPAGLVPGQMFQVIVAE